jgi:hypothetical protein
MRVSTIRRRGFAYPGGYAAGIDYNHMAVKGGTLRFSGIAAPSGVQFINLLNGKKGTVTSTLTAKIHRIAGPIITSTGTGQIAFSGNAAVAASSLTIAAIIVGPADGTNGIIFNTTSAVAACPMLWKDLGTNNLGLTTNTGAPAAVSGIAIASGTPYFVISSFSSLSTNVKFLVLNLANGKVSTASVAAPPFTAVASNGTYCVAGDGVGDTSTGVAAAVMFSNAGLSIPEMLLWAKDPWGFWYPTPAGIVAFDPAYVNPPSTSSIPFINTDWPVPISPSRIDQVWSWSQTRMLGQDRLPFRQQDWPNPTQPSRLDQFSGWSQTRMAGQDRLPNRQQDWPNPTPPYCLDQFSGWSQTRMVGQDRLPFRQQDWPNPTPPPAPGNPWAWRQTGMSGRDTLPFRQQDWPNPTQPPPPDRVWTWRQTGMAGQDILPFRQQDWPNPTQPWRLDNTWASGFSNPLNTVVVLYPHNQYDWPNPTQPSRIDQTWSWSQARMLGQDILPFRQQDWPNPTQPWRLDQTWSLSQTKMFGRDVLPFRQQDWPNPIRSPFFDQTWVSGFSNLLQGAVVVLYPHNQYDWPNPTQPPRIDQFSGWSQTRMLGQDRLPNRQQDWPNPTPAPRMDQSLGWSQTRMIGRDRLPNRQADWPNPLGYHLVLQPQRGFAASPGINLLPPSPPVIKVIYQKQFFATMGGMMSIPGDPPS